jgi:hypothetical protein
LLVWLTLVKRRLVWRVRNLLALSKAVLVMGADEAAL